MWRLRTNTLVWSTSWQVSRYVWRFWLFDKVSFQSETMYGDCFVSAEIWTSHWRLSLNASSQSSCGVISLLEVSKLHNTSTWQRREQFERKSKHLRFARLKRNVEKEQYVSMAPLHPMLICQGNCFRLEDSIISLGCALSIRGMLLSKELAKLGPQYPKLYEVQKHRWRKEFRKPLVPHLCRFFAGLGWMEDVPSCAEGGPGDDCHCKWRGVCAWFRGLILQLLRIKRGFERCKKCPEFLRTGRCGRMCLCWWQGGAWL